MRFMVENGIFFLGVGESLYEMCEEFAAIIYLLLKSDFFYDYFFIFFCFMYSFSITSVLSILFSINIIYVTIIYIYLYLFVCMIFIRYI